MEQAIQSLDTMKTEMSAMMQQGMSEERESTRRYVADAVAEEKQSLSEIVSSSIGERYLRLPDPKG